MRTGCAKVHIQEAHNESICPGVPSIAAASGVRSCPVQEAQRYDVLLIPASTCTLVKTTCLVTELYKDGSVSNFSLCPS